jgi:hypothetical protein
VFRWASVAMHQPVERMTWMVGLLETSLLVVAALLWFRGGR